MNTEVSISETRSQRKDMCPTPESEAAKLDGNSLSLHLDCPLYFSFEFSLFWTQYVHPIEHAANEEGPRCLRAPERSCTLLRSPEHGTAMAVLWPIGLSALFIS